MGEGAAEELDLGCRRRLSIRNLDRAKARPTVSTPVGWDEVEAAVATREPASLVFEMDDVLRRVAERGDLFAPAEHQRPDLGRVGARAHAGEDALGRALVLDLEHRPEPSHFGS